MVNKNKRLQPLFIALPMLRPFGSKIGRRAIGLLSSKMLASGEPHITAVGGILKAISAVFEAIDKGE